MTQLVRFGCAGVAVIIIAALTSVGLYAVLTGGYPFGGPAPKPITGGAQVLVTIQASQPTPTPISASTPTPAGGPVNPVASPSAGALSVPVAAAATPSPTPTATAAPVATPAPALRQVAQTPGAAASPGTGAAASGTDTASGGQAAHEGLSAEIIESERGWQPTDPTGAPMRVRDGHELVTVQVRFTNGASEPRYVADADLALVSDDGARFAPRQATPQREPRLLTLPLLPGDTARGWLTYETPAGQATRRLQWSPTRPDRPRAESTFNLSLPR